jgi:hypothetical protein
MRRKSWKSYRGTKRADAYALSSKYRTRSTSFQNMQSSNIGDENKSNWHAQK